MDGSGRQRRPGRPRRHAGGSLLDTLKNVAKVVKEIGAIHPNLKISTHVKKRYPTVGNLISSAGYGRRRVVRRRVGGAATVHCGLYPGDACSGQGRRRRVRRRVGGNFLEDFGRGFKKGFIGTLGLAAEAAPLVRKLLGGRRRVHHRVHRVGGNEGDGRRRRVHRVGGCSGDGRRRIHHRGRGPYTVSDNPFPNASNSGAVVLPNGRVLTRKLKVGPTSGSRSAELRESILTAGNNPDASTHGGLFF